MASKYCLIKPLADKFKQALKSGKIDPEKLSKMSSKARRDYLEKIVGEQDAKNVNALFEKKLLQKNKWNAYLNWAKEVTGIKPAVKRDLISRIQKMAADENFNILDPADEQMFLNDLVDTKLGIDVTQEEAKTISDLANKLNEAKAKWKGGNSLDYGAAQAALERYVGDVKVKGISKVTNPLEAIEYVAGNAKAIKSSTDNSFGFRQGLPTLWTHPFIWMKEWKKTWGDMLHAVSGKNPNDIMDGIKAEIYSRENSINGGYKKWGIDLGGVEEAYPETLGEKIPVFKRLYNASTVAYNGMAMRLRADLADTFADTMKKQGVELDSKTPEKKILGVMTGGKVTEGQAMGRLVNALTGRGHLGRAEIIGKDLNVLFFSPKFLMSHIQRLTQTVTGAGGSTFVKKEAAKNLLKMAAGTASVLFIADRLHPGSVDWDPRSSNFGKIKIGNTRFDVTGGMGSLITLASRIVPTRHDGKLRFWSKSATSNQFTELNKGFGAKTVTGLLGDFMMGKLSPTAGFFRDMWKQEDMQGNPLSFSWDTAKSQTGQLFAPLSVSNALETMKDPNAAPLLMAVIADGLGMATNTYSTTTNWNKNTGVELSAFKKEVGQEKFDEANKEYNKLVAEKMAKLVSDDRYKKLSDENQEKATKLFKENIKKDIFKKYDFRYVKEQSVKEESKSNLEEIKNLIK